MCEEISDFCEASCSILLTRNTLADKNEGGMFQEILNIVYLFLLRGKLLSQFESLSYSGNKALGIPTVDKIHC